MVLFNSLGNQVYFASLGETKRLILEFVYIRNCSSYTAMKFCVKPFLIAAKLNETKLKFMD